MIQHSIANKSFSPSFYEANVCLLLKKGRDDSDPLSYRPLSLLNSDQKVVAKMLATRLSKHISSLIHPDQNGFVSGRFSFFNTRRLFNIMYAKHNVNDKPVGISLYAERAFDQIEWRYMHATLRRYGFGEFFLSLIKILYASPTSAILTNGSRSLPFKVGRGTRQGCCASPLLFNLALEPLAISIRHLNTIKGITIGNIECKISLYADDCLIFLSNPSSSIPPLLLLINYFGSLSGYSINWSKSSLMPIINNLDPLFLKSLPFEIAKDQFFYLGLSIPVNPKHLVKNNFDVQLDKLKKNIDYWRSLPLSLIGRVNGIKMVSLPRFMYLFQNIPIFFTIVIL